MKSIFKENNSYLIFKKLSGGIGLMIKKEIWIR
jgi:hypothetical protein